MRRQLTFAALAVTSLVAVAFALPLALLVREVARDRALTAAEQDATSVAPLLVATDDVELLEVAVELTASGGEGRLAVVLPDGRQLGDARPSDPAALELAQQQAFSVAVPGGIDLHVPVVAGDGTTAVVRVHVPDDELSRGVPAAWAALAAVAVVLVAGAVLIADVLGRRITRPLDQLARTAHDVGAGDLAARAPEEGPPEVAELARTFNGLTERVGELLRAERERVADLSHRLRTPLTALRLEAERHGDAGLTADVDRLAEEVDRAIVAARHHLDEGDPRVDLVALIEERSRFWGALAEDDGRAWELEIATSGPLHLGVPASEVEAAIDALLGNIFAHTPEGSAYRLRLDTDGDTATLTVDDEGPGVPDVDRALRRGLSGSGSTGLGLDIARRCAEQAGGGLRLGRSPSGGTRAQLHLRVVPTPA